MTAVTDRTGATDAPAPQPAELAEIERFGMFEAEETVEKVARAIASEDLAFTNITDDEWDCYLSADEQEDYRRLARAAIAAMPVSRAEEVVRRVEALADDDEEVARMAREYEADKARRRERDYWHTLAGVREQSAARLRAALAAPLAGDGQ